MPLAPYITLHAYVGARFEKTLPGLIDADTGELWTWPEGAVVRSQWRVKGSGALIATLATEGTRDGDIVLALGSVELALPTAFMATLEPSQNSGIEYDIQATIGGEDYMLATGTVQIHPEVTHG